VATADELITWIKRSLLVQTHLSEDAAELVAFWAISTWFQDVLTVLPCLVLTGPAHAAVDVLHDLRNVCREAKLLSGFRRSHLVVLSWSCRTHLISEPNLDKRTANLLSNLTDRKFRVIEGGSLTCYSKSTAIYTGENPGAHQIQNSIHIHIPLTNAARAARPDWLQEIIARVPIHLDRYRNKNLREVDDWTWDPSGLSAEMAAIAEPLGRCIVDAPELREKLSALLKTQDKQRLYERSTTAEAVVVAATWELSRSGREHAYVREIADKANRLLEIRGETVRLSPEKVGHQLKSLGLRTRRLSQAGNGLTFDKATVAAIQQLAAVYGMEDTPAESENLHGSQTGENK
jgi:hypothetical protein